MLQTRRPRDHPCLALQTHCAPWPGSSTLSVHGLAALPHRKRRSLHTLGPFPCCQRRIIALAGLCVHNPQAPGTASLPSQPAGRAANTAVFVVARLLL